LIPDDWLKNETGNASQLRETYSNFLETRLQAAPIFIKAAQDARTISI
jgi:hypothetical protein